MTEKNLNWINDRLPGLRVTEKVEIFVQGQWVDGIVTWIGQTSLNVGYSAMMGTRIVQITRLEADSIRRPSIKSGEHIVLAEGFSIGDRVYKHTGDYNLHGEIRGMFTLWDGGPTRFVVRHQAEGGGYFCHIYSGSNIRKAV